MAAGVTQSFFKDLIYEGLDGKQLQDAGDEAVGIASRKVLNEYSPRYNVNTCALLSRGQQGFFMAYPKTSFRKENAR